MITRELEWVPAGATEPLTIRVSVSLPTPHPTLGHQCTLVIEGFEGRIEGFAEHNSSTFSDADGMLALTHALNMVPHAVEHLVRRAGGGRITSRLRPFEDEEPVPEPEQGPPLPGIDRR